MNIKDSVCRACAERMGYEPKNKIVGVWVAECDFCGELKAVSSLVHDFRKKEEVTK